ncbi:MAG: hypothetical protein GY756_08265 [bacterium]|nr:hypothetical protein [bacterium]
MCCSKKSRYVDRLKEENLKLYQDNYKLKEAIKSIEKKFGIHCKDLNTNSLRNSI